MSDDRAYMCLKCFWCFCVSEDGCNNDGPACKNCGCKDVEDLDLDAEEDDE